MTYKFVRPIREHVFPGRKKLLYYNIFKNLLIIRFTRYCMASSLLDGPGDPMRNTSWPSLSCFKRMCINKWYKLLFHAAIFCLYKQELYLMRQKWLCGRVTHLFTPQISLLATTSTDNFHWIIIINIINY